MGMDVFGYAWWRPKQLQRWRSVSAPAVAAAVVAAVANCNLQHATDPTSAAAAASKNNANTTHRIANQNC